MKKTIILSILCFCFLLTGCSFKPGKQEMSRTVQTWKDRSVKEDVSESHQKTENDAIKTDDANAIKTDDTVVDTEASNTEDNSIGASTNGHGIGHKSVDLLDVPVLFEMTDYDGGKRPCFVLDKMDGLLEETEQKILAEDKAALSSVVGKVLWDTDCHFHSLTSDEIKDDLPIENDPVKHALDPGETGTFYAAHTFTDKNYDWIYGVIKITVRNKEDRSMPMDGCPITGIETDF